MADAPTPRLTVRKIDDRSVGFLVAGASSIAAHTMIDAIWRQSPAIGGRDVAGAYVSAIYSHNERFARRFADAHGIVHSSSELDTLLARREIRCVYVGSHPRHHAETVRAALQAGKHVLCEPPLSLDIDESLELEQMAHHRGLTVALNYTWRATGAMRRVRDMLRTDEIGEMLGIRIENTLALPLDRQTWRVQRPYGGVLWDRCLHDLDLLTFLTLSQPAEIQSHQLQNLLGSESDEDVLSVIRMRGGLPAVLHDSFLLPHASVDVTVFGSAGSLYASSSQPGSVTSQLVLRRGEQQQSLELDMIDPYRASVARFLAATRAGEAPLASTADDRRAVAGVLAAHRSLVENRRITIHPLK